MSLRDIVKRLDPVDVTAERFRRGGEQCARDILALHAALVFRTL